MPTVESPEGTVTATVSLSGADQTLAVALADRTVVEPSTLGLTAPFDPPTEDVDLPTVEDFDRSDRTVSETFETTYGKRREHSHEATESVFVCDFSNGETVELTVRASAEGVAYRYRLPETGSVLLFEDQTEFRFPDRTTTWLTPWAENHEATSRRAPLFTAEGRYCTPGLFQVADDAWALVTEAGVDGSYHAASLRSRDQTAAVEFEHPWTPVRAKGAFETPWRVAVVGDLATVVESDLVPALVDGPRFDPEWVDPGRVAWSWWSESDSPYDPDRQRDYVDYAAERGWEYVLVDEGWSPDWLPELVEYAADRGVELFVWAHWTDLHGADERREKLARWAEWGVAGVKIDFMDSDEQGRLQFYDELLADAAERELLVNFHGSVVPSGLKRRWPHVMTYEGVMGAEHLKWATLTPEHNVTLPFTRNAVGAMDYTPVTFSADSRHTSDAHELALSVVYESGLQHFADSIDAYAARPDAEWFLERVPAAWDETVFLRGHPGSEATIARERDGEWFVGCITAGGARTVETTLSVLDGDREATLIRDPSGADEADDDGLVRETVTVGPETPLSVDVPENGGFALYCP
ncbi:glycoside hydrolase family 97 protein [Haloarcula marina]|uniref:glycoside hydrolase family 97 protein n=1 Tax=Haloarcula marina TaxID=2961574 RepID=UPI0020B73F4C|nr:glycoside hydrolase family 97 protein [Halomicroarcula marina]